MQKKQQKNTQALSYTHILSLTQSQVRVGGMSICVFTSHDLGRWKLWFELGSGGFAERERERSTVYWPWKPLSPSAGPAAGTRRPNGLPRPRTRQHQWTKKTFTHSPSETFPPFPSLKQLCKQPTRPCSRFHCVFLLENTLDDIVFGSRTSHSKFMENTESACHKGFSWTFLGNDSKVVYIVPAVRKRGIFSVPVSWSRSIAALRLPKFT